MAFELGIGLICIAIQCCVDSLTYTCEFMAGNLVLSIGKRFCMIAKQQHTFMWDRSVLTQAKLIVWCNANL